MRNHFFGWAPRKSNETQMKALQFILEVTVIVLLWASIWGLLEITLDSICKEDKRQRAATYISILVFLAVLYTVNPAHFVHA